MGNHPNKDRSEEGSGSPRPRYVVSARLSDDTLVETVYRPDERLTQFCLWQDRKPRYEDRIQDGNQVLVPYSARNNLIKNDVVRFPSRPEPYASEAALVAEIHDFIHCFVDVSPLFEAIA